MRIEESETQTQTNQLYNLTELSQENTIHRYGLSLEFKNNS